MHPPDCPDHGPLMLELALGRLDDSAASEAEQLILSCPGCGSWWHAHLEGATARAVDAAVADAFSRFRPHRRRLWPVAAAAAAVVVAGSLLLYTSRPQQQLAPQPAELAQRLFEGGDTAAADLTGDGVVDASDLVASLRSSATR